MSRSSQVARLLFHSLLACATASRLLLPGPHRRRPLLSLFFYADFLLPFFILVTTVAPTFFFLPRSGPRSLSNRLIYVSSPTETVFT